MTVMRSPWRTLVTLVAVAAIVAAAGAVVWRIHGSRAPVDTATVYGGDAATIAIAVTLLLTLGTWWQKGRAARTQAGTPVQLAVAAARLAEVTTAQWQEEAVRRRIVTPAPVTVRWHWAAAEVAAPRREVAMPPVPGAGPPPLPGASGPGELLESGVVTRLHNEVYARLPHGRLVLLGGPGAGKTGAMILLLLAALRHRGAQAGELQAQVPVPVWLTLGGWNPLTESLHDWAIATMNRDHPFLRAPDYGADAAGELLRTGWVTMFLDGLDELPEDLQPAALRRVDEARGLRIVLSSRPAEFRHAVQDGRLNNAAVLELRPVRPVAAAAYLLHGQAGPFRSQWEQVGAYLRGHPDTVVAQALNNPLTLSLARDAYAAVNPIVLAEPGRFPTVATVREHLIDQLLVSAYPEERQRERAVRRLAWTARHMGANRDLRWWDIPTWVPGWQVHVVRAVGFGLAGALGFGLDFGLNGADIGFAAAALVSALWGGITCGLAFGLALGLIGKLTGEPHALALRRPRPAELGPVIGFGLGGMLGFGLVGWLSSSPGPGVGLSVRELGLGLAGGLLFGLAIGMLTLWATRIARSPSATPAATYRSDRRTALILALIIGLAIGLTVGLPASPVPGACLGLTAALTAWLAFGQAPLVKLTELILTCRGHGRWHLLPLLEDACDRQLLRQAGTVYQFRHATLQDRLATMSA
jgi:hypothetical protein